MSDYIITTGKGEVWIVHAGSPMRAAFVFNRRFPGVKVASIVQAAGNL